LAPLFPLERTWVGEIGTSASDRKRTLAPAIPVCSLRCLTHQGSRSQIETFDTVRVARCPGVWVGRNGGSNARADRDDASDGNDAGHLRNTNLIRIIPFASLPNTVLTLNVAMVLWLSVRRRHRVVGPSATSTRITRTQTRRCRVAPISAPKLELVRHDDRWCVVASCGSTVFGFHLVAAGHGYLCSNDFRNVVETLKAWSVPRRHQRALRAGPAQNNLRHCGPNCIRAHAKEEVVVFMTD